LYLIRHGATANNRARPPRLQGRGIDAELSPEGREQARLTAEFLVPCPLDALYSSPLLRARQTAQPIAERHRLPVQIVPELAEVHIGRWEGMTWEQVEREYPSEYQAFISDAGVHPYLGGESLEDVRARAVPALVRLLEENIGKTIAIVAHNVVNRVYLAHLMELPLSLYRAIPQDNCGLTLLRHRHSRTRIITINGTFHLDGLWNSG
jgi:broad specificity phosphatase PhoE